MIPLCLALLLGGWAAAEQPVAAPATGVRLDVPGGSIVYDDTGGSAPPIVFLHGAFMDRRTWDRQVEFFAERYRVIRYDLRPFGESTRPDQAYVVPDDLLRLLDHLKIDRATLIGHSFGGAAALDFTLLYPGRVENLVLVSAPPNGLNGPADEAKASMAVFAAVKEGDDAIVKAWMAHPIWSVSSKMPAVATEIETITRRNLAPFRMSFAPYVPVKPAAVGRLAEVKAPTLVIVGDLDSNGIRSGADLEAKQIPGALMAIVKGADHGLPIGWAAEFNAVVSGFLSRKP